MRIVQIKDPTRFAHRVSRPDTRNADVAHIIRDVKRYGDAAVQKYEQKFGITVVGSLRVSRPHILRAYSRVSEKEKSAIRLAASRLAKTEKATLQMLKKINVTHGSTRVTRSFVPIPSVGCYVPGGAARYPSSAIMSIVPARVAGVKRIAVVCPPAASGDIDPLTVVAADMCGATEIYRTGGPQAIAALAYGTRTIHPVDKIVGPGGPFVMAAKHAVSNHVSIDMIAGPTELCVICDSAKYAESTALDIISQAEHSADAMCYALVTSKSIASRIQKIITSRIREIPRSEIVRASLNSYGFIGVCRPDAIVDIVNRLGPEHLQIQSDNAAKWHPIRSAGLVLAGDTPSAASDYLLGSNHILPTGGFGRTRGSLSVLDYTKMKTHVRATKSDLRYISDSMERLASSEGLPNHYAALAGRL